MAETHYRPLGIAERAAERAGDPSRADANIRLHPPRREGDASFCRRCDGDGVILKYQARSMMQEPVRCPDCGGEGLDPNVQHGGK